MPRKWKAAAARAEGLKVAQEALSAKWPKFTLENSDLSGNSKSEPEEKTSDGIVQFNFKLWNYLNPLYNLSKEENSEWWRC